GIRDLHVTGVQTCALPISLLGAAGPDQGYGYKLAKRMQDKLQLLPREHATDAVVGALAVALKRASLFGRAPVIHDFRLAYGLFRSEERRVGKEGSSLCVWR